MTTKRVLITGVSRGLGAALAAEFVEREQVVIGCGRNESAMQELQYRYGEPHRFSAVDVSDESQVAHWAAEIIEAEQIPDLILNNAAIINRNANLWDVEPDEFSAVIDINIKGSYYVARHFLPPMIERGSGVIVNFSSGWGRSTSPQVAPYCATKWAIEGMTQALAAELPYGLAAIPLNPGVIHTEMLESCFGSSAASYRSPEEWAKKAAPFLLELSHEDNGDPLTAPG